tara:strand:- start:543 stop:1016 length:474 start_codon:yes stop_codon:yes gene_type:complete
MEVKTSTVKSVQSGGKPFETKFGMLYPHDITMTNGDAGTYSSKSEQQDKFSQGTVVEYEWTDGQYPKIKPHFNKSYNEKFGDGGTSYNPENGVLTKTRTGEVINSQPEWDRITLLKANRISRQAAMKASVERCDKDCPIEVLFDEAEKIHNWQMQDK